jgi:hypothetical protein
MARALHDGGRLYLLDREMEGSPLTRVWNWIHRWVVRDHVRFYTSSRLCEMLREAGFRRSEVVTRTRRLFWNDKWHTSLVLIAAETASAGAAQPARSEVDRVPSR